MSAVRAAARQTFQALSVRNYRLYFTGQVISVSGTWMQTTALAVLVVYPLHGTGVDLGLVTALQFLPMLLFGTWGGLIADRVNKRTMLFFTQTTAMVIALVLASLTLSGNIELWEVYAIAVLLGVFNMFDNPARQTFISELAGRKLLPNAISLNSVLMNGSRVIGPAIGGLIFVLWGDGFAPVALCFFINAASFAAVIVALLAMRTSELHRTPPVPRAKGQLREGFRYVGATPAIRDPLLVMAVVGIFAFNFTVTLPLFAKLTFHSSAGLFGAFTAAMGTGAVIGGLLVAHRSRPSARMMAFIGVAFGAMILAVSAAPTKLVAIILLVPMGACSISFIATGNATLQLRADPSKRGRVMALYAIAFLGSTPIGAPLVGYISTNAGPRIALVVGGVATLAASGMLALRYWRPPADVARPWNGEDSELVPTDAEPGEVVDLPSAEVRPETAAFGP